MAAHTTLLSFEVPTSTFQNPVDCKTTQQEIGTHLQSLGYKQAHNYEGDLGPDKGFLALYLSISGSHVMVRGHPEGVITLDLHEYVHKGSEPSLTPKVTEDLEKQIKNSLKSNVSKSHPAIRRGEEFDVYYPTVDGRIIEYDIDQIVYEEDSKFQNIKVAHSKSFGNMLILDGDPNLAESDVLYSHSMMRQGDNNFTDRNCLILGGGDGGLLNELRKENPRSIVMVDIDDLVLKAAQKHLKGICTDSLDNYKGNNYEVIVGDAIAFLRKAIEEGRKFDFVLSDLTVVPITPVPLGDEWDFLRLVLDLGLKVLSPGGKYLTHANAALAIKPISLFEEQLDKLEGYHWNRKDTFVPSFHELWTFYEIESKATRLKENGDS